MKTIFQAFAKYNRAVNQSVLELLDPLKEEQVRKETKAYYPSIYETLLHILVTDLSWMRRYRDALNDNGALNNSKLLSLEEKGLRGEFQSDYRRLFQVRRDLDQVIIQFVNEIQPDRLNQILTYKTYKGDVMEREIWKTLLHWFNHQTHHRGQISVLLDWLGVDHDFSSLALRV